MPMNLHPQGYYLPPDSPYYEVLKAHADDLSKAVDDFNATYQAIDLDQGLNPSGKIKRMAEARKQAAANIRERTAYRRKVLDRDKAQAEAAIPNTIPRPPASEVPPVVHEQRLQEIRSILKDMDPLKVKMAMSEAAKAQDNDTFLAVEGAPFIMKLVPKEEFAKAKEEYLAIRYEDQMETFWQVRSTIRTYEANAKMALKAVGAEGQVDTADPIAEMAGA